MTRATPIDYESKEAVPSVPRLWGMPRSVWLLIAGFCAFAEVAGNFATNGRINGWGDIAFVLSFASIGVVAFINALRLLWRAMTRR
jgi:hypothetical protein